MVCNSGVAYVNSLLVKSGTQDQGLLASIEEYAPTLSYITDIKLARAVISALHRALADEE